MAKNWGEQTPVVLERPHSNTHRILLLKVILFSVALWAGLRYYVLAHPAPRWDLPSHNAGSKSRCPQVEPLHPALKTQKLEDVGSYLTTEAFRDIEIERLSGAVQIPTQSFDDMGDVGADPRWDIFYSFADYLSKTYPLTHATLQLEKINTHGLLYTWQGTNPKLKPSLIMAHQDVVPVPDNTVKQWEFPPFSGHFDGKFVWGRGASDCKNQLIAILSAVEALISAEFTPQRTLILSFGFDEEISGRHGAKHLSEYLLSKFGHYSLAAIVDEGAVNIEAWGGDFAIPGVAEKGGMDVDIIVRMPGGHSSIPPKHNGIGVAGELITLVEANPFEPHLADENPYLELLHCGAEHAPEFPHRLHKLLDKRSSRSRTCSKKKRKDELALEAAKAGPEIKYLFTSSVAVDIIHGGSKSNALPERTQVTINYRINVGSSSSAIKEHIASLAAQVAEKYNLTLHAFDHEETPSSITLSHNDLVLEPAPVTPTSLHSSSNNTHVTPFSVLSGTTRALYGKELLVSPGIMTGNTDTRYYWDLSEHIFRYGPGWDKEQVGLGNIHTVDEKVGVQAHIDTVRWMWIWIRNMDEAKL